MFPPDKTATLAGKWSDPICKCVGVQCFRGLVSVFNTFKLTSIRFVGTFRSECASHVPRFMDFSPKPRPTMLRAQRSPAFALARTWL